MNDDPRLARLDELERRQAELDAWEKRIGEARRKLDQEQQDCDRQQKALIDEVYQLKEAVENGLWLAEMERAGLIVLREKGKPPPIKAY